jgi:NSS family neurotransmitter:Na+ symporter
LQSTKTPFDLLDYLTSSIMMPLGGLLVALLAGWGLPRLTIASELGIAQTGLAATLLRFALRYLVPLTVIVLMIRLL